MEKTVSEAIKYRRSVRKFDPNKELNSDIVKKCIENGVLAPTSSNLQLWEFYHITNKELLNKISKICPTSATSTRV
jgi:nitroreductase